LRADLIVKSKSLTGSSDLTLLAPLKRGLVPSLDALTYKTRTQRLLQLLNGGRTSSHEYALQRPLSDSVERVARIHSFRVAVLEPEDKVLLAVTFDGTWESYIRVLWQKVGSLLDIIFCNTEGYVLSTEGFNAWTGWVQQVQIETAFFFNTHGLTVGDARYLRDFEFIHRSNALPVQAGLASVRLSSPTAEQLAYDTGQTTPIDAVDAIRQGLQALALLFRLTDAYLPGTPDGDVLLRAARDLLMDFLPLVDDPGVFPEVIGPVHRRFDRQLDWLNAAGRSDITTPRELPPLPATAEAPSPLDDVQGGILQGYDDANQGCLVLLAFDSAADAASFLSDLSVTTAQAQSQATGAQTNVALTLEGLRRMGVTEAELTEWLPQEFREGMEERASMLGDFRANHPRRWALPKLNWGRSSQDREVDVQLSAVHAIVQIRATVRDENWIDDPNDARYALHDEIAKLVTIGGEPRTGVRILSVQPMRRLRNKAGRTMEHFGFADGQAQPDLTPQANDRSRARLGDFILGYANEADPAPETRSGSAEGLRFLKNGSFMVVRKLRQDVQALRDAVRESDAARILDAPTVLAKMMGRWQSGKPLIPTDASAAQDDGPSNEFNFDGDSEGRLCPFHSHIRRANPRSAVKLIGEPPGKRRPRLLRRGMSYGRPAARLPGDPDDGGAEQSDNEDRGLVFIAYNSSISEQFEVIQSWVSGGNSTGGYSGQSDSFLGVPESGKQRFFRFEAEVARSKSDDTSVPSETRVFSVPLDSSPEPFKTPRPFVRLQWGAYLFVPSIHTIGWLCKRGRQSAPAKISVDDGELVLKDLERIQAEQGDIAARDAWKAAIETVPAEEHLRTASFWAAIRLRGGALRTPYGVLVAKRSLVDEVLEDDQRFSVCGYHDRMLASHFDIYLGLDDGERYRKLSTAVNTAIMEMAKPDTFALAAKATEAVLRSFIDLERATGAGISASSWELNLDAKEVIDQVQQRLCQEWLGLPVRVGGSIEPGNWRWDWSENKPSVYPAHFTPPSRYFFQPCPGEDVRRYGERYAAALAKALEGFVAPYRKRGDVPLTPDGKPAALAAVILSALQDEDDGTVARTFAGVLMGFLPTFDGNLRLVLNEWLRLKTFWSLRARWVADGRPFSLEKAVSLLEPAMREAMQFRPSPELIWRTVVRDRDAIGTVELSRGDRVVLSLTSASQEAFGNGSDDVLAIFGGARRAGLPPTHACPGYNAALGVMLGVLAAFLDVGETMRPSPAPLAFTFEGPILERTGDD
jgi:Dyp-type peroxidase family